MIVRCETCHSQFSFDERGLGLSGSTVRCSVCAAVFHVAPPQPWNLEQQPWQIRTRANELYVVRDFNVLRRWLAEGRVGVDDEVSRTGRQWTRLGDMPEWEPYWRQDAHTGSQAATGTAGAPASVLTAVDREMSIYQLAQHSTARGHTPLFRPPADAPVAAASASSPAAVRRGRPSTRNVDWSRSNGETDADSRSPDDTSSSLSLDFDHPAEVDDEGHDESASEHRSQMPAANDFETYTFEPSRAFDFEAPAGTLGLHPEAGRHRGRLYLWLGGLAAVCIGGWLGVNSRASAPALAQEPVVQAGAAPAGDPGALAEQSNLAALEQRLAHLLREVASADESRQALAIDGLRELSAASASSPIRTRARAVMAQSLAVRALMWRLVGLIDPDQQKIATSSEQRDRAEFARIYAWVDKDRPSPEELTKIQVLGDILHAKRPSVAVPPDFLPLLEYIDLAIKPKEVASQLARVSETSSGSDPLAQALQTALHFTLADAAGEDIEAWLHVQSEGHLVARALRKARATRLGTSSNAMVNAAAANAATPALPSRENLIEKGCSLVGRGDAAGGLTILLRAFDSTPDDPEVLLCMGQAHARLRQHARALALFEKVLLRASSHRVALYGAATSAAAQGDHDRAKGYFARLLVVEPTNAAARAFMESHRDKVADLPSVAPDGGR